MYVPAKDSQHFAALFQNRTDSRSFFDITIVWILFKPDITGQTLLIQGMVDKDKHSSRSGF